MPANAPGTRPPVARNSASSPARLWSPDDGMSTRFCLPQRPHLTQGQALTLRGREERVASCSGDQRVGDQPQLVDHPCVDQAGCRAHLLTR